jgi:hypothetical protein
MRNGTACERTLDLLFALLLAIRLVLKGPGFESGRNALLTTTKSSFPQRH